MKVYGPKKDFNKFYEKSECGDFFYIPAQGSPECFGECIDDLREFIDSREIGSKNIVCGDANGDMGFLGGDKCKKPPTTRGKSFFDFASEYNLVATNTQTWSKGPLDIFIGPTGSSMIDYIMVPREVLGDVLECVTLGDDVLNCSNHNPIMTTINVGILLPTTVAGNNNKIPRWNKVSPEDIYMIYTKSVDQYMQDILTFVGMIQTPEGIDEALDLIVRALTTASDSIPTSKFRPNLKPFWNSELSELKREKVIKFRIWVSEGRPREETSKVWKEHKEAKKSFAKAIKRISRQYENSQMLEAIEGNSVNRSVFWQHLKKCRTPAGSKILLIKNKAEKVVYELSEILEVWRLHFANLSIPKCDSTFDTENFEYVNKKVKEYNKRDANRIFLC